MAKIIVADENQGRRDLLANTFQRQGFDVTRSPSLRQTEATALAVFPELVLLEGEWSEGNVLETCQSLSSNPKFRNNCRIVLLSRTTVPEFLSSAAMSGVAEVIGKPIDMNQLIGQLRRHASKQFIPPPAEVARSGPNQGFGGQRFDVSMTMNDSQWALPMLRRLVEAGNIDDDFVREIQDETFTDSNQDEEQPVISSEAMANMVRLALNRLVGSSNPEELAKPEMKPKQSAPDINQINKGASLGEGASPTKPMSGDLGGSMEAILEKQAESLATEVEDAMDEILDERPDYIALLEEHRQVPVDPETVEMTRLTTELVHELLQLLTRPGAVSDITLLTQIEDAVTLTGDVIQALPEREEEE